MIFLKGSKEDCEAYDAYVSAGENYRGTTSHWAKVIEHQNGVDFCIIKNEKYEPEEGLTFEEIDNLDGWFS